MLPIFIVNYLGGDPIWFSVIGKLLLFGRGEPDPDYFLNYYLCYSFEILLVTALLLWLTIKQVDRIRNPV